MTDNAPREHISRQFDRDIESLRNALLTMGGLVEQQIWGALKALEEHDAGLAREIVTRDHEVNALEVRVDGEASHLLARRQPAAGDLRLIIAIIKAVTDLERIGDEAVTIAKTVAELADVKIPGSLLSRLRTLGEQVRETLHGTLDAFARSDAADAAKWRRRDCDLDEDAETLMRELFSYVMEGGPTVTIARDVFFISRSLQRMGDHCCNICEYVIYLAKGKDVRHVSQDLVEQLTANHND